jgi:hypothetical protein
MRRIVLLTVWPLMALMIVASAVRAFAKWEADGCRTDDILTSMEFAGPNAALADRNGDGFACHKVHSNRSDVFYDNRR